MEARLFEKQPGLVKMHKVANVLMWISWVLVFFAMLAMGNYFLPDGRMLLFVYSSSGGSGGSFSVSHCLVGFRLN